MMPLDAVTSSSKPRLPRQPGQAAGLSVCHEVTGA